MLGLIVFIFVVTHAHTFTEFKPKIPNAIDIASHRITSHRIAFIKVKKSILNCAKSIHLLQNCIHLNKNAIQ